MHHVGFYLIKHCSLHWSTTWPLINQPYKLPFEGPQGLTNPKLK